MAKKETLEEKIAELERLIEIQCTDGTWNYSEYHFGMTNGMIFALSVLTDNSPEYFNAPDMFLNDIEKLDKFNNSSIIVINEEDNDPDS